MPPLQLIQIPFSHNCVKVRRALELKGLPFETLDIAPMDRAPVRLSSGQGLVPVLVDGERTVADSTEILIYLESAYPEPPLLPADPRARAECLVLEDWTDAAFMALTRRLAYWSVLARPGALEAWFFPGVDALSLGAQGIQARQAVVERFGLSEAQNRRDEPEARRLARLAVERLAGRPYLVGDDITLADVSLAAMSYPLCAAAAHVREDPHVRSLLEWGRGILGESFHPTG